MHGWFGVLGVVQVLFAVVVGLYFWHLLKNQRGNRTVMEKDTAREMDELNRLRALSLAAPLTEKVRPVCFAEVIGQDDAIKAMRASLCGPNP